MTTDIYDFSDQELRELMQECADLLKERAHDRIEEKLNKLYSIMGELNKLDSCACVIDDGKMGYNWYALKNLIQNTYQY